MFHDFYSAYLDHQHPNDNPSDDSFYTRNRDSLTFTALSKASLNEIHGIRSKDSERIDLQL